MQDDPVVADIRRIREEIAARFNYDIDAIGKYARERDAADNRNVIRLPPRRPDEYPAKPQESPGATSPRS
jgi:hypothetical protein